VLSAECWVRVLGAACCVLGGWVLWAGCCGLGAGRCLVGTESFGSSTEH